MPPQQDSARIFFLIVLTFWIFSTPDNGPLIAGPNLIKNRLARQRTAHGILNSTSWGDFDPVPKADASNTAEPKFLNLTGFREQDKFAWDDLGRFRQKCDEWSLNAVGAPEAAQPVWQNATGVVHGLWHRESGSVPRLHSDYNLTQIAPNVTWAGSASEWSRNVTGSNGKMLVRIEDDDGAGTEPEVIDPLVLLETEVRAREVTATFTLEDVEGSGNQWDMRMHGVHWPRQGAMLFTTTSEKFAGIFGLPHLTNRPDFYATSQALLNRTLNKVLSKKEQLFFLDQVDPWASSSDSPGDVFNPTAHCEYLAYVQIHPPEKDYLHVQASLTGPENIIKAIHEVEDELRYPRGVSHLGKPKLQMSAVLYSPDCAYFIESKGPPAYAPADGQHLLGMKQETFLYSITVWLIGLGVIVFGQVQLLKLQMRETSTPSTLGRISFYTASIMLLADGTVFIGSIAWSLSASTTLLPSLLVTGASFLSMMTGNIFLSEIYKVQEPEWRREERERERLRQQRIAANAARYAAEHPQSTTAPAATPQPALQTADMPIIVPSDQDLDAEIEGINDSNNNNSTLPAPVTAPNTNTTTTTGNASTPLSNIFGRLVMCSTLILFLTLATTGARPSIRTAYFNLLSFGYLSLWWPQIYRNAYRNCRRALTWRFVVGQSVLRILPIAYFYLIKDNFAFAEPDWMSFAILAGWVWTQIVVLVAQSILGPRFGVPKGYMPEAWEYHPILKEDNVEAAGLPIGLVAIPDSPIERVKTDEDGSGGGKRTTVYSTQCVVCRENLEVPVLKAGEDDPTAGGVAGVLARRAYMVTPCRHIFHSDCLEQWLRFRLQCPICREELPPL